MGDSFQVKGRSMNFLTNSLKTLKGMQEVLHASKERLLPARTVGILPEAVPHFCYGLHILSEERLLIVSENEMRAKSISEHLRSMGAEGVFLFGKREIMLYSVDAESRESANRRLRTLSALISGEARIVVTTQEAMMQRLLDKRSFIAQIRTVGVGDVISLHDFKKLLTDLNYHFSDLVEGPGQFSSRGGILDVFCPVYDYPVRIEFFDDEVDSVRFFDLETQVSIENVEEIKIFPAGELFIDGEERNKTAESVRSSLKKQLPKLNVLGEVYAENARIKFEPIAEALEEGLCLDHMDMILPFMPRERISDFFEYFEDGLIFYEEVGRTFSDASSKETHQTETYKHLLQSGELLPEHSFLWMKQEELLSKLEEKRVYYNSVFISSGWELKTKSIINFQMKSVSSYYKKINLLTEDLHRYLYRGYKICLFAGSKSRARLLLNELTDANIPAIICDGFDSEWKTSQVFILSKSMGSGFEYTDGKMVFIGEGEIFRSARPKKKSGHKIKGGLLSFSDLQTGDFIVHESHGIGRYEGVRQLEIDGVTKDFLSIGYAGTERLYVPIDQLHMIQKYIGGEGAKPKLNKLSGSEWKKTTARAKHALHEMAQDLIELYAKREHSKGFAFSKDQAWQRDFEDLFPYEETEGQLRSVEEIKKDMESFKPMDRLLCGDVGYGKTEVALRAAFKAISDGKQVALLVPTTILAEQHYNTIKERFSHFPVDVAVLSRFRSQKEQKETIKRIEVGRMDIVVGTHRILSKDIRFKDLGLLIIDEEQRFGVKHKEKLKQWKETVDVLTLTATPIPRTLHLSLSGIRDISVLDEPPEDRFPIQTYVSEYNPSIIREAVLRELERGGQIYFVYNRVETIDRMQAELEQLIPEASFVTAHGQMVEKHLEDVMFAFLNGEYDVLICTTIIETGLDIPNVNTIIISDADRLGLSQLYQLRGRVGRSNRVAYGYMTYAKNKVLTEISSKRLQAIKEFTEFGSGFKIAMRDLEIRGAGNMLGLAQHGHMGSIGYELYVKYLNAAIRKMRGEPEPREERDTTVEIPVDAYITSQYIPNDLQRLEIYKKIAAIRSSEDYDELIDELIDRFGDVPRPVMNLMDISFIRFFASQCDVQSVMVKGGRMILDFYDEFLGLDFVNSLMFEYRKKIMYQPPTPKIIYIGETGTLSEWKKFILRLCELKLGDKERNKKEEEDENEK